MRTLLEIILAAYTPELKAFFEWLKSLSINWAGVGWAFAGSSIATVRSKRRSWWEGLLMLLAGTVASMALTPEITESFNINANAVSFLVGLGGWGLTGAIINVAKNPIGTYKEIRNIQSNSSENLEQENGN